MKTLPLRLAGEVFLADAARALVWPDQRALLIADLHLGKSQVFRHAGVAMPEGSDECDLRRLTEVVARHAVERLFLLGDIVHGATALDASWRGAWQRFASHHRELDIIAITGNHDRHDRGALSDSATVASHYDLGPLRLNHLPLDPQQCGVPVEHRYVIAGHLHPLSVIADGRQKFRLPCFWQQRAQLILPAFGSTTRGQPIDPAVGDYVIAVTPAGLLELPQENSVSRSRRRGR